MLITSFILLSVPFAHSVSDFGRSPTEAGVSRLSLCAPPVAGDHVHKFNPWAVSGSRFSALLCVGAGVVAAVLSEELRRLFVACPRAVGDVHSLPKQVSGERHNLSRGHSVIGLPAQ